MPTNFQKVVSELHGFRPVFKKSKTCWNCSKAQNKKPFSPTQLFAVTEHAPSIDSSRHNDMNGPGKAISRQRRGKIQTSCKLRFSRNCKVL